MKKKKLKAIKKNYQRLLSYRKVLSYILSISDKLSDKQLVRINDKIDELSVNLIRIKNEFESEYDESIVFYNSKIFEAI